MQIDDYVYDVTKFANLHPGGLAVLRMVAGEDATKQFYALHNKDVLAKYHDKLCVGVLEDSSKKDLKLEEATGEDLISLVPYAEIPLLRKNWAPSPWWTESHRAFLLDVRMTLTRMQPEVLEIEAKGEYVSSEMQQRLGATGILACLNGTACMGVAQKLKNEGRMKFPGNIEV